MNKSLLLFLITMTLSSALQAGGFTFAWLENNENAESNPNVITHPIGYTGDDNQHLEIKVCIHSGASEQQAADMEIPIKNAIARFNALEPELENTVLNNPEVPSNAIDFESVFMHELGHCMGLAHPNLASEATQVDGSLTLDQQRFGKALQGTNGAYDLDAGPDGVIGTADDERCDDVNTNWFPGSNDPFAPLGSVIDQSTYSVDAGNPDSCNDNGDLPPGHSFVEIAGLLVGPGNAEAVMHQGTRTQETQRNLNFDDAAMLRLAMSGFDREQETADDYTYQLEFQEQQGTHGEGCDITVNMTGSSLGVCRAAASEPVADHFVLVVSEQDSLPRIEFDPEVNWHFNTTSTSDIVFQDRFELVEEESP